MITVLQNCDAPFGTACILLKLRSMEEPLPAVNRLPLGTWAAPGRAASPALLPALLRLPLLPYACGDILVFISSTRLPKENVTVSSSPAWHRTWLHLQGMTSCKSSHDKSPAMPAYEPMTVLVTPLLLLYQREGDAKYRAR